MRREVKGLAYLTTYLLNIYLLLFEIYALLSDLDKELSGIKRRKTWAGEVTLDYVGMYSDVPLASQSQTSIMVM